MLHTQTDSLTNERRKERMNEVMNGWLGGGMDAWNGLQERANE